jgi:hypothetical protein
MINIEDKIILKGNFEEKIEYDVDKVYQNVKITKKDGKIFFLYIDDVLKLAHIFNSIKKVEEINRELKKINK